MITLKEFTLDKGTKNLNGNYELSSELIDTYKDEISKLKEFKNVKLTSFRRDNRDVLNEISVILYDNDELKKDIALYSVELIPIGYASDCLMNPVKDGATVIQNLMKPNHSIVSYICFTVNVEQTKEESLRDDLHSILDKILENPTEYVATPIMGLKITGVFGN